MPGRGPVPKPKDERRTRHEPQRGEWVDLAPLEESVLPDLPEGEWSERTRTAWAAWSSDPVTSQYGPADIQAAIDLAYAYEAWARGRHSMAGEVRQREDRLGLNPKGKRDLRWRIAETSEAPKPRARKARKRAHLTAVQ